MDQTDFREQCFKRHIRAICQRLNGMGFDAKFIPVFKSHKLCVKSHLGTSSHTTATLSEMFGDLLYFQMIADNITSGINCLQALLSTKNFFRSIPEIDQQLIGEYQLQKLNDHLVKRVNDTIQRLAKRKQDFPDQPLTLDFFGLKFRENIYGK